MKTDIRLSILFLSLLLTVAGPWGLIGVSGGADIRVLVPTEAHLVSVPDSLASGPQGEVEGDLRYGPVWNPRQNTGIPGLPLPIRPGRADDIVSPLGRIVTHDLRTDETVYSERTPSGLPDDRILFRAGTTTELPDQWSKDFSAYQLVTDPTLPQYRDKVKLNMIWVNSSGDTLRYVASGTLIGPSTVITAGHCVFNDVSAGTLGVNTIWADEIRVTPAYGSNNTAPYGTAKSVQLHSWSGWVESQDYDHDIGIIDLDRPIGALTGWEGFGADGSCDFFTGGGWVHSDYPAEDGYDGQDMYTETGSYDGCEILGNEVWYDRPGHGGSSGGGAIKDKGSGTGVWAVRSNTSWSIDTGFDSWDTRLTSAKFSDISEFIAADEPPAVDFIPLRVVLSDSAAVIGRSFPLISFRLFNASSVVYTEVVDFDLYLSTDDNISTADVLLARYKVDVAGVGANFTAELIELAAPAVPTSLVPGDYFVGVVVTTPDWDAGNNESDGQDAASIRLDCEPTFTPTMIAPADSTDCLDGPVFFEWSHIPSAMAYQLVIFGPGRTAVYEASTNSMTIPSLIPGSRYWWTIAAIGACGEISPTSSSATFSMRGDSPAPPTLVFPADNDSCLSTEAVPVDWSDVAEAVGYELRIGTSCGVGSLYYTSGSDQTVQDLSAGTTYYWTARAVDLCGQWSEWSACHSFYTGPTLTTISGLRTPFLGQGEMTVPVLLDWEDAPGATSYEVRVGLTPDLGPVTTTGSSSALISDLEFNTTYYWTVRPLSLCGQSGGWSPVWDFQTIGPGPNLTFATTAAWAAPVVPRPANDATTLLVPAPNVLPGDTLATYWNLDGLNSGDVGSGGFHNNLRVDGEYSGDLILLSTAPGERFAVVNRGPVMVRGGKHTFECAVDATNSVVEQHEGDNEWARQWTWTPATIPASTPMMRKAPPDKAGGHESVPWTEILWWNCDGVRFNTTGWWNALVVHTPNAVVDYDVSLHTPSADPNSGFDYLRAISMRPPGCTDAVLVNRNISGSTEAWDAGVFRQSGTADYQVTHIESSGLAFGTTAVVHLAQDEMLALRETSIAAADTGWISVLVDVDPAGGPVYLNWLDRTFDKGGLLNYTATGVTDSLGHLALSLRIPTNGFYCAVVYRDVVDGTGPIDVTLKIGPPVPDLAAVAPDGWYAPLVPRATADVTYPFVSVPAPAYLLGDTTGTHYYANIHNLSPVDISAYRLSIQRDGAFNTYYDFTSLPAGGDRAFHGGSLAWVPGGLHTLALVLDPLATLVEAQEDNNAHGEQWGWIPIEHAVDEPGLRGAPPERTGGWTTIPGGITRWPNCDGIRTPRFSPIQSRRWIVGTAILPLTAGTDYDLTLFATDDDAATAFRTGHVTSDWGVSQSDFAVVRLRDATEYQWDVGVTRNTGSGEYIYHTTEGPNLGTDPMGDHGPARIAPREILNLYEAYLNPGLYTATVRNDSGTVDWGVSVIDRAIDYASKSDTYQDGTSPGIAWQAGPGQDQSLAFEVFAAGYYGLAVWKVSSADALKGGIYTLRLANQLSGVESAADDVPVVSAISSVWPNPFNPMTTISLDLAVEAPMDLSVFDLQGRLVRILLAGTQSLGKHEIIWRGTNQSGQPVTSGVYFVRLRSGGVTSTQKITLVR